MRWKRASDALSLAWPRLERARALIALDDRTDEASRLLHEARGLYDMLRSETRVAEIDQLLAQIRKSPSR